jgi:metal-responsive CopG/Arc/MetJ family transcriptional regulator
MARPKKDGKTVSLIMEKDLFEKLEAYCKETYLTKTAAIEKALNEMIDKYEKGKTIDDKGDG